MRKRVVAAVLVLLVVGAVFLVAGCGGGLPKDAVAKVGNTLITQQQFDKRTADFELQFAGQIPDKTSDPAGYKNFQAEVLDYMITYELVKQKAPGLKVTVTDADLQKEIDNILQQSFGGDQAKFDAELKAQNMTLDQLKASYSESLLLQKVYDEVTKNVTTVPDADVASYYNAHKSQYFTDETRTVRHILISPTAKRDAATSTTTTAGSTTTTAASSSTSASSTSTTAPPTDQDWNAALTIAQKVRADLVGGADWKQEASQYSDDPSTKSNGGDLGTVSKGEMVAEFEQSVFSMKQDEVSQPVKTIYGYHIIQVTGITPAKQSTLDEVKPDITGILLNQIKGKAWQDWVKKTKAEIGVTYKPGLEPTTTTSSTATTLGGETSTTTAGGTDTTAAGGASTTASGTESTTTTVAPTTTAGSATTTTAPQP